MSIYRVIDKLETTVREGTLLPLKYRVLSEEKLFELIEKMRSTLPEEVGKAKLIAKDKDRVIREAQEKAQAIVSEASAAHTQMIDQNEIVRQARATAEIVLREAEERAAKIRAGADQYAAQVLGDLEARLATALGSVKRGQEALTGASAPAPGPAKGSAKSKRAAFDNSQPQPEPERPVVASVDDTAELEPVEVKR